MNILIFTMSSTCFECEGSYSGRWLYIQVWYNLFRCLHVNMFASWRWTPGFETCRRHHKN